jgi:fluoride ion exporter CrcB/FEX
LVVGTGDLIDLNFTSFATIKFLTINVIATALASIISYYAVSTMVSSHLILWITVMPVVGTFTSLFQLTFIKSMISKKGEWIAFNSVASIVLSLAVIVIGLILASLLEKFKIHIPRSRYTWVIIEAISGALASSIIAVGHWHILQVDNKLKIKWVTSIVITASTIYAFAGYAFTFIELAK